MKSKKIYPDEVPLHQPATNDSTGLKKSADRSKSLSTADDKPGKDQAEKQYEPGETPYDELEDRVIRCQKLARHIGASTERISTMVERLSELRTEIKDARRMLEMDKSELIETANGQPKLF